MIDAWEVIQGGPPKLLGPLPPTGFQTDGCSHVPDVWRLPFLRRIDFRPACAVHDWHAWIVNHGEQYSYPETGEWYVEWEGQEVHIGSAPMTLERGNRIFRKNARHCARHAGSGAAVSALAGLVYPEATDRLQHLPRWLAIIAAVVLLLVILGHAGLNLWAILREFGT